MLTLGLMSGAAAAAIGAWTASQNTRDDEEAIDKLISAAHDNRLAVLTHLIEDLRLHVDARSMDGFTALATAAGAGHVEVQL